LLPLHPQPPPTRLFSKDFIFKPRPHLALFNVYREVCVGGGVLKRVDNKSQT
jgi:hypothetical protein